MSDEVQETPAGATRVMLGAIAFILALLGGEVMIEKEGTRELLGVALAVASIPLWYSAVFWKQFKSRLNRRALVDLNNIATSVHWWIAIILLGALAVAATSLAQSYVWLIVLAAFGAIVLALYESVSKNRLRAGFFVPGSIVASSQIEMQEYIADVSIALWKLKAERVIEIKVHVFNATASAIRAIRCDGSIQYRCADNVPFTAFDHPPSMIEKEIPSGKGDFIILTQHVPSNKADFISKSSETRKAEFDFSLFNIWLSKPAGEVRLEVWNNAVVKRTGGHLTERVN